MTPVERTLERLQGVRTNGSGWQALCPAHPDRVPSLSVSEGDDNKVLLRCFAGCAAEAVVESIGLRMVDLFPEDSRAQRHVGRGETHPPNSPATAQPLTDARGCTLAQYADDKRLPIAKLRGYGLSDMSYLGSPAVRIPYLNSDGTEVAVRFRTARKKGQDGADGRFRWKSGAKPCLYGLSRLTLARDRGYAVIVEGESDCHTLWHHGEPGVGVPGSNAWNEERDAPHLDDIPIIYLVQEPDRGGETLLKHIATSRIRERVRIVSLGEFKDQSALHLDDPDRFVERWRAALEAAVPWTDLAAAEALAERNDAWAACSALAQDLRILNVFGRDLRRTGLVGEERAAKLLYLVVTSRLLDRPASGAIKGPSSAGKSHLVDKVLEFFPSSAFYALSAMSERALAYSEEPLRHRVLVLYEAAGLSGDFASYLVRSLLSEGCVRYETVEKDQ